MSMKFEINRTKIKGGCPLGRKVVPHDSKSDLPLPHNLKKILHLQLLIFFGQMGLILIFLLPAFFTPSLLPGFLFAFEIFLA